MNNKILQMLQLGNIIAVIFTIIVNGLANVLPIGGKYTGELSDNIPNLFVPAGITFAIWGIIYILTILFAVYLAKDLFKKEKTTKKFLEKIGYFFILACLANIIWIFLWHYEQIILSLLAMLLLFISLLIIYLRLNIGIEKVTMKEKLLVHVPISVYIGWITVATIANVTAVLVTINWDGFGISEELWTILVLIVATIITILVITKRKDYAYSAVIIWALIGIYLKRITDDANYGVQNQIAYTAIAAIVVILIIDLVSVFINYPKKKI
ncbi:hypothetical protein AYK20_09270 [Thermoplasmatales archaeon SG8-52-1]|nr:MAG: hypothetical protein AYK20_09270 [Thermoplasmatales archaeon SG8-52-1]